MNFLILVIFSAQECNISSIEADAFEGGIVILNLANNRMESFDMSWLGHWARRSLSFLDLSNNLLDTVPSNMALCSELKNIRLANNKITAFPESTLKGTKIHNISLEGNPCKSFDGLRLLIQTHTARMEELEKMIGVDSCARVEEGLPPLQACVEKLFTDRFDLFVAQARTCNNAILLAHKDSSGGVAEVDVALVTPGGRSLFQGAFFGEQKVGVSPATGGTVEARKPVDPATVFPTTDAGRRVMLSWLLSEMRYFLLDSAAEQAWTSIPLVEDKDSLHRIADIINPGVGSYQQRLSAAILDFVESFKLDDTLMSITPRDQMRILKSHPKYGVFLSGGGRVSVIADNSPAAADIAANFAAVGAEFILSSR